MADKLKGFWVPTGVGAPAPFSGSNTIAKIYNGAATTYESITFGVRNSAGDIIHNTSTGVVAAAGSYLEGPILYYSASAATVAYIYD